MTEAPKAVALVSIEQMTDVELQAEGAELGAMGRGRLLHADEMLRYLAPRRQPHVADFNAARHSRTC
jgi:hypothetical protein